jgi:peptidoglycan hydrolase-like amidase
VRDSLISHGENNPSPPASPYPLPSERAVINHGTAVNSTSRAEAVRWYTGDAHARLSMSPRLILVWLLAFSPCIWAAQVFRIQISSPANTQVCKAGIRNPRSTTVAVDLDEYVEGVLAGEASTVRSPQALDAMAVIVRTWALRYRGATPHSGIRLLQLDSLSGVPAWFVGRL